jgi:anion-transporting  ArsA/GET3 family ATPase
VREIVTIGKILWEVREDRWDMVVVDSAPTGQIASYLRAPASISELVATGRIRAQAEWMAETLADQAKTQLVLVTLAEELPTAETQETIDWVERTGIVSKPIVIANRVLEAVTGSETPAGAVGHMVTLHRSLVEEQGKWLDKLPPDLGLPYLFGLFTPGEVAAHISDDLEALS